MKLHKALYIFFAASIIALGAGNVTAAPKKSKASTTQTSKKKSSKKSTSKKSSSKAGTSKKKKTSGKQKSGRVKNNRLKSSSTRKKNNVAKTTYKAPPAEQPQYDSLTMSVNRALLERIPEHLNPGGLRVNSVKTDRGRKSAIVSLNENFTYLPVTNGLIDTLQRTVRSVLPDSISNFHVALNVGGKSLAYYITKVDKLPAEHRRNPLFVSEVNPLASTAKGMDRDIIALWHSHGRYYKNGSWQWQRPLLFQTVEDMYPMGYVLPFLVPMLENAGAYVLLPRERDTNNVEVIVDNDTNDDGHIYSQPYYREKSGARAWTTGEYEGFIYDLPDFRDTENPFENGTYRQTTTVKKGGGESLAGWYADIPSDGEYAVYVSYKTLPNSTTDARYTVNYSGGSKEFIVNQKMGGSTWVYLGTFPLEEGYSDTEPIVTLSNVTSGEAGTIVTADAVKIGGGMGNIARSPRRADVYYDPSTPLDEDSGYAEEDEEDEDESIDDDSDGESSDQFDEADNDLNQEKKSPNPPASATQRGPAPVFRTSGMPRFLEGARYWLHWAGFPEYVYSPYHGNDDYKDDYTSRGHWVNYLAGGSRVLPGQEGLNIPVDAVFALHTDAGKRADDSFVGTLGIYFTQNGASYRDGTPRINSRMLTDMVMQQITNDIRRQYEPRWTRRSMWDKSYVEARVPEVPTTLIELMSHQNFADMQYGLDPTFRFTVSRAIYKGIARFLAQRKDRELVIQPLPPRDFMIKETKKGIYRLSWQPTPDPLEPTAKADKYIIMERTADDLGFHKIAETHSTHFDIRVADHEIHSFRIIAANEGGQSFPSETLALKLAEAGQPTALIINGFTRISGPDHFSSDGNAGFDAESDFGVPYVKDISFTGYQTEFRRSAGEGFGRSNMNYATQVVAGNTFDFAAVHGAAAAAAGYGFVSTSAAPVENGKVSLSDYPVVDLILGKQKRTVVGPSGKQGVKYAAFPDELVKKLDKYVADGGHLVVSGQFVATELYDMRSDSQEQKFARDVLGITKGETDRSKGGRLRTSDGRVIPYSATLNEHHYIVETPDVLEPVSTDRTRTVLTFADSGRPAGIEHSYGKGKATTISVPLETITEPDLLGRLFKDLTK